MCSCSRSSLRLQGNSRIEAGIPSPLQERKRERQYNPCMAEPPIHLGTSSFTASGWQGSFYPKSMKRSDYLSFYAERFDTVEVDSTFYACPSARTVSNWALKTPPGGFVQTRFQAFLLIPAQGFHCDRACHVFTPRRPMKTTVVSVDAWLLKLVLEVFSGNEGGRLESAIISFDRVASPLIDPIYRCTGNDLSLLRHKTEIVYRDRHRYAAVFCRCARAGQR
jgi:hypothetical protein